tara:strand:+ start:775 stop:1107 length:333 start_codon:yes stop_codon:yes gene_type:complete
MGFFSFETQDTDESIPNIYCGRETFTVFMRDDQGNIWEESNYDGYGDFGGKDFYELLAEMNGLNGRGSGINLAFDKEKQANINWPTLTRYKNSEVTGKPKDCKNQGYFYE